ncbi:MAG TPA: hypothetical protein VFB77_06130 [Acidimicrobiales bacterium]|nr:hypothetical protein [Acidimicrobiales bacterium]
MGATATAVAALSLSLTAGTAGASVCDDGWTLYHAYADNGYNSTAWAMLETLALNGCY